LVAIRSELTSELTTKIAAAESRLDSKIEVLKSQMGFDDSRSCRSEKERAISKNVLMLKDLTS